MAAKQVSFSTCVFWHRAGEMHYPYEWVPYIVEISIMKIGNLVVLAVPGEFTTMSGRRLIRAVRDKVCCPFDLNFTNRDSQMQLSCRWEKHGVKIFISS